MITTSLARATITVTLVPEPASVVLLGLGVCVAAAAGRRARMTWARLTTQALDLVDSHGPRLPRSGPFPFAAVRA